MNELFNIPEVKSPRLKWLDQHGVWTSKHHPADQGAVWKAEAAGHVGYGPDEDSAIIELAIKLQLRLWNEQ